jgi:hypothetical protein
MQQDADRRLLTDWAGLMHALGPNSAERAECCDANDTFVAENFAASNNWVCLPRVRRPSLVAAVHPILTFARCCGFLPSIVARQHSRCPCTRTLLRPSSGVGAVIRRPSSASCGV